MFEAEVVCQDAFKPLITNNSGGKSKESSETHRLYVTAALSFIYFCNLLLFASLHLFWPVMDALVSIWEALPSISKLAPPAPGVYTAILHYFQYFPLVWQLGHTRETN